MRAYSQSQGKFVEVPDTSGAGPSVTQPTDTTPALQRWENNLFVGPLVKYGGGVLEATRKLALLADPEYRQSVTGGAATMGPEARARVMALDKPVFTSEHQQQYVREHPVEATAKNFAGVASYVIPAGKTLKAAVGLGGVMGGLRAFSEEKATPTSVLGGTVGGGVAGGLFYGAGKAVGAIKNKWIQTRENVGKAATQEYLKTTPAQWARAMEEKGIDPNVAFNKYVSPNSNYDDALAQMGAYLDDAERQIQATAKAAGTNVRISGDDVIAALQEQAKILKPQLGSEAQKKALDRILLEAERKYANGTTVNKALITLRYANNKFGKSIVETEGGAMATSAQKLEANSLRETLKAMFPEIKDSLRDEEVILTLRPIVQMAKAKANTAGFPSSLGEFFRERVIPKIASKARGLEGGVPQTPAGLQKGATTLFSGGGTTPSWQHVIDELDDVLAKGNKVKAEELGYAIKNMLKNDPDFQVVGNQALAKITTAFPGMAKSAGLMPIGPVVSSANPTQKLIEEAINSGNTLKAQGIVNTMPVGDPYKQSMQSLLDTIVTKTKPGLQPGSMDLGYVSDFLKSGPKVQVPTAGDVIKTIMTQAAGLGGAEQAGMDVSGMGVRPSPKLFNVGGVPSTPSGLNAPATVINTKSDVKSTVSDIVQTTSNESERRMKLAYLMWKYPTKATMIKSAYEAYYGKPTTVDAVTRGKIQDAESGLRLMNTLKSKYEEVQRAGLTASGPGLGIAQGLFGSGAALLQTSPEAAAYKNSIAAFMSRLARASGEKGVLTDPDIERIRKAIPTFYTAPETARQQWQLIEDIISGAIQTGTTKGSVPETPEDLYNLQP